MASHFGPGGAANGFTGRGTCTAMMLIMVVAVPRIVASTAQLVRVLPVELINLPNRDYWLAPERRAATLEALSSPSVAFALAVAVFLCFVHWLVVLWLFSLFRRFGRVP